MPDAYTRNETLENQERCGCGAGLSSPAINVIHAETGQLLTRFCHRCAGDLLSPSGPRNETASAAAKSELH